MRVRYSFGPNRQTPLRDSPGMCMNIGRPAPEPIKTPSLKAHLKQLVDGQDLADDHVGHDLDALRLQFFNLIGDDSLRQTELRNAVDQNAAGSVQRLKQGHRIALLGKQRRAGQAGRAGADDSDLDAVGLSLFRHGVDVLAVPVGDKALQTADRDWLALVAADALGFALRLLRTDTGRKGRAAHWYR